MERPESGKTSSGGASGIAPAAEPVGIGPVDVGPISVRPVDVGAVNIGAVHVGAVKVGARAAPASGARKRLQTAILAVMFVVGSIGFINAVWGLISLVQA